MDYEIVKQKYNKFIYRNYQIEEDKQNLYLKYNFEIENLTTFQPVLTIPKKNFKWQHLETGVVRNVVFHIGMIEAISYWKATCSPYFDVRCGTLGEEQIQWFKKLIYLGTGEFRYQNKIKVSQEDFVQIVTQGTELKPESLKYTLTDVIIPIGGGKDSNVTLELLKQSKQKRFGFRMNMRDVARKCAEIAGLSDDEIIEVKREIEPNLLALNQKGFLNGHIPFSAVVAFITYFTAVTLEKKYIALSNEESANESNIKGENINHQYSKTIEFENDFREYVTKYITPNGPEYFSFLRPINEIQIAQLFSEFDAYHPIFKSCNLGSKSMPWKWCGDCPKCLFAYIILSPFLEPQKMVQIFGEDLFEKESLLEIFIELCGYGEKKPFECVGTYQEIRYAISKTIQNGNQELPFLLQYYKTHFPMVEEDMLHFYHPKNNLPKEFDEILRGKILTC